MKNLAKSGLMVALAAFAVVATANATKLPDPRICTFNNQAQCGRAAAAIALRTFMGHGHYQRWNAQIECRGYAGLLRYGCSWPQGSAVIVFAPVTFKATVTVK